MASDVIESPTRERRQRGAGVRSSGGVSEQGRRIDQTPKREAADGPYVASMTSLNLPERMNELSDGRSARSTPRGRGDVGPYRKSQLTREGTRMKRVAEILTIYLIGGLLPLSTMAA